MQTDAQKLVVVRDQFAIKSLSDDALKQILPAYQEAFRRLQWLLANLPPEGASIERELWLRTQLATIDAQFKPVADRIYQILPEAQARAFEEALTNAQKYLEAGGITPQPAQQTTLTGVTAGGQQVSVSGNLPGFNITNAVDKGFISPSITRQQVIAAARETGFSVLSPGGSKVGLAELLPNWMEAQSKQVERHLRAGFLVGSTNDEIMREIGPLGPGRKGWAMTEAVVRTAMAEASQSAHDAFYEANADLLIPTKSGYRWWWDASNDTRLCPLCAPLDGVKFKEREKPPAPWPRHFSCVLGDAKVSAAGFISAARAWYSGDIVTIRTRSGRNLSVTSQHPVMSVSGWVRAADVRAGMKLICQRAGVEAVVFDPNLDNGPATAADVFAAFRASSEVRSMSVPASPVDFHGDGVFMESNVEVVTANRPLVVERDCQQLANGTVVLGDAVIRLVPESALGDLGAMFVALSSAANGVMSLAGKSAALIGRRLSHSEEHSLSSAAYGDARLSEPSYECGTAAGDLLRQLLHGHSALVESDEVIEVEVNPSHGVWVYDFGAAGYAYAAEGILSHNCRCKLLPWTATQELLEQEDGPASGSFLEATPVQYDKRGKRLPPPEGYTGDNAYKRPMKIDGKQQWVRRRDLGPGQTTAGDMLQNANEHSKRLVLGKHTEAFNKLTGPGGKYEKNPQGAVRELLGKGLPPGSTAPRPTRGPGPKPKPKPTPVPKQPPPPASASASPTPAKPPAPPKTQASFNAETAFEGSTDSLGRGMFGEARLTDQGVAKKGLIGKVEYEALTKLAETGVTPKPLDIRFIEDNWDSKAFPGMTVRRGYMLMERCPGAPLAARTPGSTKVVQMALTPKEAENVFEKVMQARKAIHMQGIAHQDMHAANVIYDKATDRLTVIDLGTARLDARAALIEALGTKKGKMQFGQLDEPGDYQSRALFQMLNPGNLQAKNATWKQFAANRAALIKQLKADGFDDILTASIRKLPRSVSKGMTEEQALRYLAALYDGI
jgi:hypothetical protein